MQLDEHLEPGLQRQDAALRRQSGQLDGQGVRCPLQHHCQALHLLRAHKLAGRVHRMVGLTPRLQQQSTEFLQVCWGCQAALNIMLVGLQTPVCMVVTMAG